MEFPPSWFNEYMLRSTISIFVVLCEYKFQYLQNEGPVKPFRVRPLDLLTRANLKTNLLLDNDLFNGVFS